MSPTRDSSSVRTHVQFNIPRGLPERFTLADSQASEGRQLRATLRPDCCCVMDRGSRDYPLLADIIAASSDFLVRLRRTARSETLEEPALTAADQAAGVRGDARVRHGWRSDQTPEMPDLRRLEIVYSHRRGGQESMILLTSRFALPASLIALIYQHRRQVELFFRWIRCTASFKHFFSESQSRLRPQPIRPAGGAAVFSQGAATCKRRLKIL